LAPSVFFRKTIGTICSWGTRADAQILRSEAEGNLKESIQCSCKGDGKYPALAQAFVMDAVTMIGYDLTPKLPLIDNNTQRHTGDSHVTG
jgi:hypothetical protein